MSSRIISLRLKNFKCFDNSRYYEFKIDGSKNPVILSGPNGFGKTTFFDAIELIFSKQITRLDQEIESKRTNLGKNLLLNEVGADGHIILTLEDENQGYITTLLARIAKENHKIDVEKSILYGMVEQYIPTEELDTFLGNYNEWNEELVSNLRYRKKDFNVYYYISQAESVHFLKRSVSDRKNAMDVLLKTDSIDNKSKFVNSLIGARTSASTPINNEIKSVESDIATLVKEYKSFTNNYDAEIVNNENVSLGLYDEENELFYWDNPQIDNTDIENIKAAQSVVERLYYYSLNQNDFMNKRKNDEIEKLCNKEILNDYTTCREYIREGKVDKDAISAVIQAIDKKVQIYNVSKFFTQEKPSPSMYDENDVAKLKTLLPELEKFDFSLINTLTREILDTEKNLSSNQNILAKLESARASLREANENFVDDNGDKKRCPYCNTEFNSIEELNIGFEAVSTMLKEQGGNVARIILQRKEELYKEIQKVSPVITSEIVGIDDNSIDLLISKKTDYQKIIMDNSRLQNIEKLVGYLDKANFNKDVNVEALDTEIKRVLSNMISSISNPEFDKVLEQYDFYGLVKQFGTSMSRVTGSIPGEKLLEKMNYLNGLMVKSNNTKALECKDRIKELIVKREKLQRTRDNLNALGKVYETKLNEYKRMMLDKLRIPLLIYTGKILQDYQNGLGVFIDMDNDDMRFVSNGDAKHDILNTFSSGQLSGFVMAFLFAMNKQYIKKSSDDLGFILIDDPVQTMDDINIASLIEVMRNDFANKQIILSTHETDKENYILYKFLKYSLIGQSFNVKENLYGN